MDDTSEVAGAGAVTVGSRFGLAVVGDVEAACVDVAWATVAVGTTMSGAVAAVLGVVVVTVAGASCVVVVDAAVAAVATFGAADTVAVASTHSTL
jgi:hypothetical protein